MSVTSYLESIDDKIGKLLKEGLSQRKVAKELNVPRSTLGDFLRGSVKQVPKVLNNNVRILVLDIETAPIAAHVWGLWQNNVGLNQIERDWHILSFAAKWYGDSEDEVFYYDQSSEYAIEDDFNLCHVMQDLINQATHVLVQNGRKFDLKKINARCVLNGLPPLRPVHIIDTLEITKREFGFTSNKLEYMTDKLCVKYKKLKHKRFAGHELWTEVLKGNPEAWQEMKEYNINDILSLEELYDIIKPFSTKHPNVALQQGNTKLTCRVCGSTELTQDGHWHTALSKYELFRCECGAYSRGRKTNTTKQQRGCVTMSPLN